MNAKLKFGLYFFAFISIFTFIFCKESKEKNTPSITVFIHGTKPPLPDNVLKKINKVCFCYDFGLFNIKDISKELKIRNFVETICAKNSEFLFDHFYVFGWSGKLDPNAREKTAQELYDYLYQLVKKYEKIHKVTPKINLITHSHGGNVALNLAKIKPENNKIIIDKLILLACPVQKLTQHYIKNPIFKKIYSLYLTADMIQILDPQGFHDFNFNNPFIKPNQILSERKFSDSDNLFQVEIEVNGSGISHMAFTEPIFAKLLPLAVKEIDTWPKPGSYLLRL